MTDDSAFFSAGGHCEQFWHEQRCPFSDAVHPAFPLPTMASPALQGALRDGFGEAVVACDIPEPCKFPSLDSCKKSFLWTHKEVGLELKVEDAEKFPDVLGLESLGPFVRVSTQGPGFTAHRGGWR